MFSLYLITNKICQSTNLIEFIYSMEVWILESRLLSVPTHGKVTNLVPLLNKISALESYSKSASWIKESFKQRFISALSTLNAF